MAAKSPDNDNTPPIAIIGGGLAGTMFLVHTLVRIAEDPAITSAVSIKMFERYPEQMQGGVAYSNGPAFRGHNLNSGARSLNFFPAGKYPAGFPNFVEYIEQQAKLRKDPALLHALTDPPRQLVSEYMKHMLDLAIAKAGNKAHVDFEIKNVVGLDKKPGGGSILKIDDGTKVEAAHVVLATGFQESLSPKFARAVAGHPNFVGQPYNSKANAAFNELCPASDAKEVLIIGTGLTAMDIASRLIHSGYKGKITMMSRRGLMHHSFEPTTPEEYIEAARVKGEPRPQNELEFAKHPPKFLEAETIPALVRAVASEYRELTKKGFSSIEILSYWERFAPDVAAKFPKQDVAALYGAYETLITSLRAGVTPETGMTVQDAIAAGQVRVKTGTLQNVEEKDGKMQVTYERSTGKMNPLKKQFAIAHDTVKKSYDFVFSAMGNSTSFDPAVDDIRDPLWAGLIKRGAAVPHWTKAGVEVSRDFSLTGKDGKADTSISVIGVPVAGHMVVTKYAYPDFPAIEGGKVGPASLNASAIMSETLTLLDARYKDLVARFKPTNNSGGTRPAMRAALGR